MKHFPLWSVSILTLTGACQTAYRLPDPGIVCLSDRARSLVVELHEVCIPDTVTNMKTTCSISQTPGIPEHHIDVQVAYDWAKSGDPSTCRTVVPDCGNFQLTGPTWFVYGERSVLIDPEGDPEPVCSQSAISLDTGF